MKSDRIKEQM